MIVWFVAIHKTALFLAYVNSKSSVSLLCKGTVTGNEGSMCFKEDRR